MSSRGLPLASRPSLGNSKTATNTSTNATTSRKTLGHKHSTSAELFLSSNPPGTRHTHIHAHAHSSPQPISTSRQLSSSTMNGGASIEVGDAVDVPGGMTGVVKFLGGVKGKNGIFVGVELSKEFAQRGKNDGDVDGIQYFSTLIPGSGIFLPAHRATKRDSQTSTSSFPLTPTTPSFNHNNHDLHRNGAPSSRTPPTPSVPKFSQSSGPGSRPTFSQSVGSGARATSPQHKQKPRGSLPRPESPLRKTPSLQPLNAAASNVAAPASATSGRPSLKAPRSVPSPAPNGRPAPKPVTPAPNRSSSRNQLRLTNASPDVDSTPTANPRYSDGMRRMSLPRTSNVHSQTNDEETAALKRTLDERDRQLKEQAASLAEMESSLVELQSLMASNPDAAKAGGGETGADASDIVQLRMSLREKNERIAVLTAEFDSHRADFRSTIDTLEMASTETERVYEKRVQELLQEVEELQQKGDDVATVAAQLKQLEDLVQELEEGLEDARRGEAEARSEVEFLRGEVERARLELRREREKAARALKGAGAAVGGEGPSTPGGPTGGPRDLEQRDDEIRGLKAIIHSLSSGADVGTPQAEKTMNLGDSKTGSNGIDAAEFATLKKAVESLQREKSELQGLIDRKNYHEEELERENARLRSVNGSGAGRNGHMPGEGGNGGTRSGQETFYHAHKDSSSTITATTAPSHRNSANSAFTARRPDSATVAPLQSASQNRDHERNGGGISAANSTMDDSVSAADTDTLWCEICETGGHDILTCTQMFGAGAGADKPTSTSDLERKSSIADKPDLSAPDGITNHNNGQGAINSNSNNHSLKSVSPTRNSRASSEREHNRPPSVPLPLPLKPQHSQNNLRAAAAAAVPQALGAGMAAESSSAGATTAEPAPSSATSAAAPAGVSSILEDGPAAGKSSGLVDMSKWCALCEKDGHESVDCPFEEEF